MFKVCLLSVSRSNSIGTSSNVHSISFNRQNSQPKRAARNVTQAANRNKPDPTACFDDDGDNDEDNNDDDNDKEEYVEYGKEQEASRVANAEKRSINEQGDQQQSDMGEELAHDDNDEEKYDSVELENSLRSFVESSSESESSLIGNNETSIVSRSGKRITYLRILYEWLRGLYSIQMRSVSKSTGCLSSSLKRLNRTPPASTPKQHNSNSNNQAARRHLWLFRRRTFCARKSSTTPSTT